MRKPPLVTSTTSIGSLGLPATRGTQNRPLELDPPFESQSAKIGRVNGQVVRAAVRRGGSLTGSLYSNADAKRCDSVLLSATQRIRAAISERGAAIC